eukprot:TRINITY_DN5884_c0_g2_i10.p2 TRINITY_DN5884_c0_g2~~TRINITY_DN5884_c0_g2_i10.p2  ORF type:complete len:522 (-),score=93.53 TRINITY_DN5884_c0_g2_i10:1609-3174(-)
MLDQAESLRRLINDSNNANNTQKKNKKSSTKIITVTSGKGGVGKSNFVVNLAIELQKKNKKVLIFDADLGMGNDDVLLGLYPKHNIFDIIFNSLKMQDIIIEGPAGISLIPAGSGINRVQELSTEERNLLLNELEKLEEYDYLLMDTGAGISKDILSFISASEDLIIITTPEPTSLTDAYSLLKVTDKYKLKSKSKIVINRAFTKEEGKEAFNKMFKAVNKFLKIEVEYLGCILDDRKLVQSVRAQKPFILLYPNCDASKNIQEIASKIIDENIDSSKSVKGLFKKLFNIFSQGVISVNYFKIEVNNIIEVIFNEKYYKSLVIDTKEDSIRINIPLCNDEYLLLKTGETIEINSYLDELNCYKFYCDVILKGKDNNIIYYELTKPYNISKIQRRDFYRVRVLEEIEYIDKLDKEAHNFNENQYKKALMINLSGGGARIKIKESLKKGDVILINTGIEGIKSEIECKIVRIEKNEYNESICGVEFLNITDLEVDKIVKKLFDIMRKQRANQLKSILQRGNNL